MPQIYTKDEVDVLLKTVTTIYNGISQAMVHLKEQISTTEKKLEEALNTMITFSEFRNEYSVLLASLKKQRESRIESPYHEKRLEEHRKEVK